MDVLVDAVDEVGGQVMVLPVRRVGVGELDHVVVLEVVDRSDVLAIGAEDFHVFPDLR